MATIKTLVVKVIGDIAGLQDSMRRGTQMINTAGQNMQSAGRGITAAFTLPAAGFAYALGTGIDKATGLQAQMSGVQAILGATADETARLQGLVQDLAIDPQLKVNAEDAANAVEMLARNGLGVEEIMSGAARGVVLLSNATGSDFSQAADMATDVMALWKMEASELETAVDGITSVVNNSKFSVNDYALALAQGGGVAATVGVEFNDFNAAIAAMSPLFASGADAGTSLKTMMQRLVPQTNAASDAMRSVGLAGFDMVEASTLLGNRMAELQAADSPLFEKANQKLKDGADTMEVLRTAMDMTQAGFLDFQIETGILQTAFHNLDGSIKSMPEIVDALNTSLGGLSDKQKTATLSTIFGTDAMRAAAGLASQSRDEFVALQNAMGSVSAADNAATRIDNLSGDMEILSSVLGGLKLQLGAAFLPLLRDMVQRGTDLMSTYGPVAVDMLPKLTDKLSDVIDRVTSFVSTVVSSVNIGGKQALMIGAVVSGFVALLGVLGPLLIIAGAVVSGFGAISGVFAVLMGPVGIIIGLVVALAAAWATNWGGIRDITGTAIEFLRGRMATLQAPFDLLSGALTFARDAFGRLYDAMPTLVAAFQEGGLSALLGVLSAEFSDLIPESTVSKFNQFRDSVSAVAEKIRDLFAPTLDRLREGVGQMLESFTPVSGQLSGVGVAFGDLMRAMAPVGAFVGAVLVAAFNLFLEVVAAIMPRIGTIVGGTITATMAIINGLTGVIQGVVDFIVAIVNGDWNAAWDAAKNIVTSIIDSIVGLVAGLATSMDGLISGLVEGVIAWFTNLWDVLVGNSIIPDTVIAILDWVTVLHDDFIAWVEALVATVQEWFQTAYDNWTAKITETIDAIKNAFNIDWAAIGSSIVDGVAAGISNGISTVTEAARSMAQAAFDAAMSLLNSNSPSRLFRDETGSSISEGTAVGILNKIPLVIDAAESMVNAARSAADVGTIDVPFTSSQSFVSTITGITDTLPELDLPTVDPIEIDVIMGTVEPFDFDQRFVTTAEAVQPNYNSTFEHLDTASLNRGPDEMVLDVMVRDSLSDLKHVIAEAVTAGVDREFKKRARKIQTQTKFR